MLSLVLTSIKSFLPDWPEWYVSFNVVCDALVVCLLTLNFCSRMI